MYLYREYYTEQHLVYLTIIYSNNIMEFFIAKDSSLPILKMDVVKDGRTDSSKNFYESMVNSKVRFSMKNEENGIQKIFMRDAIFVRKTKTNPDSNNEYYVVYKWTSRDTKTKGRYIGEFLVVLESGELISPIRENLYINIV